MEALLSKKAAIVWSDKSSYASFHQQNCWGSVIPHSRGCKRVSVHGLCLAALLLPSSSERHEIFPLLSHIIFVSHRRSPEFFPSSFGIFSQSLGKQSHNSMWRWWKWNPNPSHSSTDGYSIINSLIQMIHTCVNPEGIGKDGEVVE